MSTNHQPLSFLWLNHLTLYHQNDRQTDRQTCMPEHTQIFTQILTPNCLDKHKHTHTHTHLHFVHHVGVILYYLLHIDHYTCNVPVNLYVQTTWNRRKPHRIPRLIITMWLHTLAVPMKRINQAEGKWLFESYRQTCLNSIINPSPYCWTCETYSRAFFLRPLQRAGLGGPLSRCYLGWQVWTGTWCTRQSFVCFRSLPILMVSVAQSQAQIFFRFFFPTPCFWGPPRFWVAPQNRGG